MLPAEEQKQLSDSGDERRRHPRIPVEHVGVAGAEGQQHYGGGILQARVTDLSDGGIGVEIAEPLEPNATVWLVGELHGTRFCVGLQGTAWVAHCHRLLGSTSIYRVGLEYVALRCLHLPCCHLSDPQTEAEGAVPRRRDPRAVRLWGEIKMVRRPAVRTNEPAGKLALAAAAR